MALASIQPQASMVSSIQRAINEEAQRVQEEVIQRAVRDFEADLRKRIGSAAISVAQWYEIHVDRGRIVIEVNHNDGK